MEKATAVNTCLGVLKGRDCIDVYKRQYLSWPLLDKEREAGDYSKRFAKGKVYRIKMCIRDRHWTIYVRPDC